MKYIPNPSTALGRLRIMCYVEGLTLLALVGVGVPLKHFAGRPELVSVLGPIHGAAFLLYALWLFECSVAGRWKASEIIKLFVAAFIPFGFVSSSRLLARKDEAGIDPGAASGH